MRTYYAVRRNLLIRFKNDSIDETPALAAVLQESAAASNLLELTLQARARGGGGVVVNFQGTAFTDVCVFCLSRASAACA